MFDNLIDAVRIVNHIKRVLTRVCDSIFDSLVRYCINLFHIEQGHTVKNIRLKSRFSKLDSNLYSRALIHMKLAHTLQVPYGSRSRKIICRKVMYSK